MRRGSRFAVSVTIQCALIFFLAFAVFGWGLHAKLSLYEANSHSVSATAKLSTKERPSQWSEAQSANAVPPAGVEAFASRSLIESLHRAAIEPARLDQVTLTPRAPSRVSLNASALMLRPPPDLAQGSRLEL